MWFKFNKGTGSDNLTGGTGADVYVIANGDSLWSATSLTKVIGLDTITIGNGDKLDDTIDTDLVGASGAVIAVTLAAGDAATVATFNTAVAAAITEADKTAYFIKVTDNTTDTTGDGNFTGYYLVVSDGTTFNGTTDTIVKLSGVADTTTIASSSSIAVFTVA